MVEVVLDYVCDVMMLKDKHNSINRWYISKAKTSGRYSSNVLSEKSVLPFFIDFWTKASMLKASEQNLNNILIMIAGNIYVNSR